MRNVCTYYRWFGGRRCSGRELGRERDGVTRKKLVMLLREILHLEEKRFFALFTSIIADQAVVKSSIGAKERKEGIV